MHTHEQPDTAGDEEDPEVQERKALGRIIFALRQYRADTEWEISRWEHNYSRLPPRHRVLLHTQPAKFAAARRAAHQNQFFLNALLAAFEEDEGIGQHQQQEQQGQQKQQGQQGQLEQGGQQQQQPQPHQQQEGEDNDRADTGVPSSSNADTGGSAEGSTNGSDADANGGERAEPRHFLNAAAAGEEAAKQLQHTPAGDIDKVRYVLKNLARDWSEEGATERQQSYGRIITELRERLGEPPEDRPPPRVLIPGAGLARLCLEVAAQGYEAQGNEFSYFMLLASSFILNHTACAHQWTIHPWMHGTCNHVSDADQLRAVAVPDVAPGDVVRPGLLSMCAGDFVEVYSSPETAGSFEAVVTCFFLDTAHNVIEYLEIIHRVLRAGGFWIHLGPLLWHWADSGRDELSIEVSFAEVQRMAYLHGFTLLRQEFVDTAYIANVRGMYKTVYQSAFWTMQKTGPAPPESVSELMCHVATYRQRQKQQQQDRQQQGLAEDGKQLAAKAAADRGAVDSGDQPLTPPPAPPPR